MTRSEDEGASLGLQQPSSDDRDVAALSPSLSKSVIGSAALLTASSGLTRLLSMLTAPILTSVLGPSPYGVVALAGTATALITTLALVGVETSYTRAFFSGDPARRTAVERFCWRFVASTTGLVSVLVGTGWLTGFSEMLGIPREIAPMIIVGTLAANANMMVMTAARLRSVWRRIAISSAVSGIVTSASAIALALWWRKDAWALVLSAAIGGVVGMAVVGGVPLANLARPSGLTRQQRWAIFQIGLPVALTAPMYWVLSSSDRWFIGLLQDEHSLGVYSFAYNVGNFGALLNVAVTQTWLPETARFYEADPGSAPAAIGNLWARTFVLMAIVWLGVSASGGDVIRLLAAPEFHAGAVYVPWMAGGIFFYGLYHIANTGLMLRNNLRPAAAWWLFGGALSLVMNSVLVRRIGPMGAAITATVSFAVIAAGVLWSSQKVLMLELPRLRLALVSGLLLVVGLCLARPWHESALLSLALKFPVGVIAAAVALWITAPAWLLHTVTQITRRKR